MIGAVHICTLPLSQVVKIVLAFAFNPLRTPVIRIVFMALKNLLLPHRAEVSSPLSNIFRIFLIRE